MSRKCEASALWRLFLYQHMVWATLSYSVRSSEAFISSPSPKLYCKSIFLKNSALRTCTRLFLGAISKGISHVFQSISSRNEDAAFNIRHIFFHFLCPCKKGWLRLGLAVSFSDFIAWNRVGKNFLKLKNGQNSTLDSSRVWALALCCRLHLNALRGGS